MDGVYIYLRRYIYIKRLEVVYLMWDGWKLHAPFGKYCGHSANASPEDQQWIRVPPREWW